jgi:putative ABC transport system substrate-binding protein
MNIGFVSLTLVGLLGLGVDAVALADTVRIGFLGAEAPDPLIGSFRAGMRERGYVEGRNLVIEERWASGDFEQLPRLARELIDLKVDAIVTVSTPALAAASKATKTIPIVIAASADPVASGFVASLARPGGNITGLTLMLDELSTKRLEILKELAPHVKRVAVLWSAGNPVYRRMLAKMEEAAPGLDMQIDAIKVRRVNDLESALRTVTAHQADALYVFEDPIFGTEQERIIKFAAQARLPAIYGAQQFVEHGGLVCYAPSFEDLFRRAAGYVDRILKGAKPAELPIEQPTVFRLSVNLKAAQAAHIAVPESILLRADEVIR